jgi:RimJ/RimL family protein N-acetyltransferase|tara:strand:- start:121 stop:606 length:486 start_codon:yes stop_codon:yes gene_type:complete
MIIESERLKTSILSENDIETLFNIYSDKDAMKFRGSKPMLSIDDAVKMVSESQSKLNGILKNRLSIRLKSNNQLIGTLLIKVEEQNKKEAEIGISFGIRYWNKGYGYETIKMTEKRLKDLKYEKIKAWCKKENKASIKLLEKCDFYKVKQNTYPESYLFYK